jgi:hypothetical protein
MAEIAEIKKLLEEQNKIQAERNEKIDDIHFAIFGNERAGVAGMAKTLTEHGKTIAEYKKLKYIGLGIATVSGASIWQIIKTALKV